jgi:hypothetical protein
MGRKAPDYLFLPTRALDLHNDDIGQDMSLATLEELNDLAYQWQSLFAAIWWEQLYW